MDSSELYLEYGDYKRALRGKYGVFFFDGGGMKGRVSLEKNWTPVFYTTAGLELSSLESFQMGRIRLVAFIKMGMVRKIPMKPHCVV
ncbi:hypothetical protein [Bdellovibrio bacteriovorus]|uniref:hypothetical protein n=1 Tax=Bdellovibrio bacteriovorus TaxID=959 RepID=UPI003CFDD0FA